MKRCKNCIWFKKINEQQSFCPFSRCVKKNGWLSDKDKKVKNNGKTRT